MPTLQTPVAVTAPFIPLQTIPPPQSAQNTSTVPTATQQGVPSAQSPQTTTSNPNAGPITNPTKSRICTSNHANLIIALVVSAFAIAAYIAQLQGNWLGRRSNVIAETAYEEQIWKDCRDRNDLRDSAACAKMLNTSFEASMLPSTERRWMEDFLAKRSARIDDGPAGPIVLATFTLIVECSLAHWPQELLGDQIAVPIPTSIWRWFKTIGSNVFVGILLCHGTFLFLLRDVRVRHRQKWKTRRPARTEAQEAKFSGRATPTMFELFGSVLCILTATVLALSLTVGLETRLTGDLACSVAVTLMFSTYCVLEPHTQRVRTLYQPSPDEEILEEKMVPERRISIPEVRLAIFTTFLR